LILSTSVSNAREAYKAFVDQYGPESQLRKRQTIQPPGAEGTGKGSFMDTITNWGSVIADLPSYIWALSTGGSGNPPQPTVPEVQILPAKGYPADWNAKRVKIRYGPFRIPPQQEKNFNKLAYSMEGVSTSFRFNIKRPCDKECMLLSVDAGIEYADGTPADITTGAIFHHSVLLNVGPTIIEPTCNQPFLENVFMSGNEKTPTNYAIPESKVKSGYVITAKDTFLMNTELQNLSNKEKYVWETVYYDLVEGTPKEFESSHIVWMTVGSIENPSLAYCRWYGGGEFPWGSTNLTKIDQPVTRVFQEHSSLWHSDKEGTILQAGGHLHDGGLDVMLFKNNEMFCDSVAHYTSGAASHHHGKRQIDGGNDYKNTDLEHIDSVQACRFPNGIPLAKGDIMHIQANYDFTKHKGMKNGEGKLDQIMGMAGK
jgi:hypothetical protein